MLTQHPFSTGFTDVDIYGVESKGFIQLFNVGRFSVHPTLKSWVEPGRG